MSHEKQKHIRTKQTSGLGDEIKKQLNVVKETLFALSSVS